MYKLRDMLDYKGRTLKVVGFTNTEYILETGYGSMIYVREEWVHENCKLIS